MQLRYDEPIAYSGSRPCTVEFASTLGGAWTHWRIKYEDGEVRTGFCAEEATMVIRCAPGADIIDYDTPLQKPDIHDCRALKSVWLTWKAVREEEFGPDLGGV